MNTMFRTSGAKAVRTLQLSSSATIHSTLHSARNFTQRSLPSVRAAKPSPGTGFTFSSHARPTQSSTILQRLRNLNTRFLHNTRPRRSAAVPGATEEPTTLGGRLKKLSREYGWSALGVYLLLSALDFPFCYLLVRTLGTDRIGRWEHAIISNVAKAIPDSVKQTWHEWRAAMKKVETEATGDQKTNDGVEMAGWGVEEADERNQSEEASLATQLALAYAIHKSFIFVRVPLTAAVTPKIVKMLRQWGWDIGKRTSKETKAINRTIRQKPKAPKPRSFNRSP